MFEMKDIKEMTFLETLKDIPNRAVTLIWKLMSVKVMIMAGAFYLVISGKVDGWNGVVLILFMALIVIFGREAIKFIEALKGLK
jgi:hypothetical protein